MVCSHIESASFHINFSLSALISGTNWAQAFQQSAKRFKPNQGEQHVSPLQRHGCFSGSSINISSTSWTDILVIQQPTLSPAFVFNCSLDCNISNCANG
jgi:hypothetical protein